jgi:chromosome partitioning protein
MKTIAERHPMEILGVVISFWNARAKNNSGFLKIIEKSFPGGCFDTKVRRDVSVSSATVFGKPIFEIPKLGPKSRAAEDYLELAKEISKRLK